MIVVDNRDEHMMGRVLSEGGTWLVPLVAGESGLYKVPDVGDTVRVIADGYYLAQETDYGEAKR